MSTSNEAHNNPKGRATDASASLERTFKKGISSLEGIFEFIEEFSASNEVVSETRYALELAIEELFTNMVKYSPESDSDVLISLTLSGKTLQVCLTDYGVKPFDPTKAKEVDINLPLDQRKPGGLGIFLTKKLMETIQYKHTNGNNIITLIKHLE